MQLRIEMGGWQAVAEVPLSGDGIFCADCATRCAIDEEKNRPIIIDSR
ncbi:MAG: hypothetical protein IRY89_16455 [Pseudolabrys sp.]|jgi:hypothetical protein|nr:hypothetical protein [Pseudolabrys sp.]